MKRFMLSYYVLFSNLVLHLGQVIITLPLPLGTLHNTPQPEHLKRLWVFASLILFIKLPSHEYNGLKNIMNL